MTTSQVAAFLVASSGADEVSQWSDELFFFFFSIPGTRETDSVESKIAKMITDAKGRIK